MGAVKLSQIPLSETFSDNTIITGVKDNGDGTFENYSFSAGVISDHIATVAGPIAAAAAATAKDEAEAAAAAYTDTKFAAVSSASLQGEAVPATDPGANVSGRWWMASTPGTYTNFDGVVVAAGEFVALFDDGATFVPIPIPTNLFLEIADSAVTTSTNLFSGTVEYGSPPTTGARWSTTNGSALTTANYVRTTKFAAAASTTYVMAWFDGAGSYGSLKNVICYDSGGAFLPGGNLTITEIAGGIRFTTIAGTAFIGVNLSNTGQSGFVVQMNLGTYLLPYEAPGTSSTSYEVLAEALDNGIAKTTVPHKNLFNPAIIYKGSVNGSYGFTNPNSSSRYTEFDAVPAREYTISGWALTAAQRRIAYYDAAGALISGQTLNTSPTTHTVTTPAGTVKVFLNIAATTGSAADYASLQIELGGAATLYEPYAVATKYIDYINGNPIRDIRSLTRTIDPISSNKILFFGCSYTESHYAIAHHSWVRKLSQFLDYPCFNFGLSGDRIIDELKRFRDNTASYGVPAQVINGSVIWIGNMGNETLMAYPEDLYLKQLREFIEFCKGNGAQVVLSTDHRMSKSGNTAHPWLESAISDLAREYDCYFVPSGVYGLQTLVDGQPAQFWGALHPGTRTNGHQTMMQTHFLSKMARPLKAIKVYRKRPNLTISSVQDLNYELSRMRVKKWLEIQVGEVALRESDSSYEHMDDLGTAGYNVDALANEYYKLATGQAVNFADYALIEAVIDVVRPTSIRVKIKMADVGTFYVKNNKSSLSWEDTTANNTAFKVSKAVYDAVTISVGDTYTSPSVTVSGTPTALTYTGKLYDYRIGYILCFSHISTSTSGFAKVSDAGGNLTRTSGAGTTPIAYTSHDKDLEYSYGFFSQLGKVEGGFEALAATYSGGYKIIDITGTDLQKYLDYDKLKVVVYDGSAFDITGVIIEYTGGEAKREIPKVINLPAAGTELMTLSTIDASSTGWTLSAGAANGQDTTYQSYPTIAGAGSARHISLPFTAENAPETAMTVVNLGTAVNGYRKLVVKVWAQIHPKVYTPGGSDTATTTTSREVLPENYNFGTLCLGLHTQGASTLGQIVYRKPVDLGWAPIIFEIDVPAYVSGSVELTLFRDPDDIVAGFNSYNWPLRFCYFSAQLVN